MKYLLEVETPHPSLLPLAYAKLGEIGVDVVTVYVPPSEASRAEDACPTHGTALTPIPEAGWVCEECSE